MILNNLNLNKKLALAAIILGVLAIFLGNPYRGNFLNLDAKEVSLIIEKENNKILPDELADWIIKKRADYKLIDLREKKDFDEYAISGAECIPPTELVKTELSKTEKIILYSDDESKASELWLLLRGKGYKNVYILKGGIKNWKDVVLFPKIPVNPTAEQLQDFEKKKEVAKFFGGVPQTEGTKESTQTPKITAPKLEYQSPGSSPGGTTKKKEGC